MNENDQEIIFEKEMDMPEDWESNVILCRRADGIVEEVAVPDDDEGVDGDA